MGKLCFAVWDAQFYDAEENVCSAETAAMVGIVLRGSKTTNTAEPKSATHSEQGDPELCPVLGLAWMHKAAICFGTQLWEPITSMGGSQGLGNGHVFQMLKALA